MLKVYSILLLNLCWAIVSIDGDCKVRLKNEVPLVVKNFGTRKIVIREKNETTHQLVVGENLYLYCTQNLKLFTDYNDYIPPEEGIKGIELACLKNNKIHYRELIEDDGTVLMNPLKRFESYDFGYPVISCSQQSKEFLYESQKSLKNCRYMSYALGTSIPNLKDVITAGICYDFNELNFKFINYLAYRPKYEFLGNPPNMITDVDSVTLDTKLEKLSHFFRFMSSQNFSNLLTEKKIQLPLLNAFEFDFESIIQQPSMRSVYEEYSDLLNIIWWRNLRLGNWKLFTDAVEQRATSVNYNIYLGVVGNLSIPETGCNNTETFTFKGNDVDIQAPIYIWAYLKALQSNISEEFVVIGYNSPFYQTGGTEIFCKDMCDEISWLQSTLFSRLRLMHTMGLVFCCHPTEVADKFDNFPYTLKTTDVAPSELPTLISTTGLYNIKDNSTKYWLIDFDSTTTSEPLMD